MRLEAVINKAAIVVSGVISSSRIVMLSLACSHGFTCSSCFKVEEAISNEKEKHSVEVSELKKQLAQVSDST